MENNIEKQLNETARTIELELRWKALWNYVLTESEKILDDSSEMIKVWQQGRNAGDEEIKAKFGFFNELLYFRMGCLRMFKKFTIDKYGTNKRIR